MSRPEGFTRACCDPCDACAVYNMKLRCLVYVYVNYPCDIADYSCNVRAIFFEVLRIRVARLVDVH